MSQSPDRAESRSHPALQPGEVTSEVTVSGRLMTASNASFVATAEFDGIPATVIYKPIRGERELWDFPSHTLAHREVAAYRVSHLGGFDLIPFTTMGDGPFGPGSVQRWIDTDSDPDELVDVWPADEVPDGWHVVVRGEDADGDAVAVAHAEDSRLRTLAVLDALVNNADRKAGHLLVAKENLFGCDHGVSFHTDPKLRTLLWGWGGEPLTPQEVALVRGAAARVDELAELLSDEECQAVLDRAEALIADGLPTPNPERAAVPWPLW